MKRKNVFVAHRWDGSNDRSKVENAINKARPNIANYSVKQQEPLNAKGKTLTNKLHQRIDSSSMVVTPARPSSTTPGSATRKELDYALKQGKQIIAIDTGATTKVASYFDKHNIPVIKSSNKTQIAKALKKK